jgi:hypothetical protein
MFAVPSNGPSETISLPLLVTISPSLGREPRNDHTLAGAPAPSGKSPGGTVELCVQAGCFVKVIILTDSVVSQFECGNAT